MSDSNNGQTSHQITTMAMLLVNTLKRYDPLHHQLHSLVVIEAAHFGDKEGAVRHGQQCWLEPTLSCVEVMNRLIAKTKVKNHCHTPAVIWASEVTSKGNGTDQSVLFHPCPLRKAYPAKRTVLQSSRTHVYSQYVFQLYWNFAFHFFLFWEILFWVRRSYKFEEITWTKTFSFAVKSESKPKTLC